MSERTCSFDGCGRPFKGHGLCAGHLDQRRRGVDLTPLVRRSPAGADRRCEFPGCGRRHKGRGLCVGHLNQRRHGVPLRPLIVKTRPTAGRRCSFLGCTLKHAANGFCAGHANQQRRRVTVTALRQDRDPVCTFDGCDRPHQANGLCKGHCGQVDRGQPLRPLFTRTCILCNETFPGRQGDRCHDCATYPAEIRRRHIREARQDWTPQDYDDRRAYAAILRADPCCYCGKPIGGEVDHIQPLHAGGGDDWANLTASCRSCNASKTYRSLLVFLLDRTSKAEEAAA